ncbi:MAG: hypothetical protein ACREJ0_08035 [Geminicoccaceae bacterium]
MSDEHELVDIEARGEGGIVRGAEPLLVRQPLPVGAERPAQGVPYGRLDPIAPGAGVDQGIGGNVVDEPFEHVVEARPAVGMDSGIVEGDRIPGRLADRRPGQLEEQHLAIAGDVGVACDAQLAEGLAGEGGRRDRERFRFRCDHREPEARARLALRRAL